MQAPQDSNSQEISERLKESRVYISRSHAEEILGLWYMQFPLQLHSQQQIAIEPHIMLHDPGSFYMHVNYKHTCVGKCSS